MLKTFYETFGIDLQRYWIKMPPYLYKLYCTSVKLCKISHVTKLLFQIATWIRHNHTWLLYKKEFQFMIKNGSSSFYPFLLPGSPIQQWKRETNTRARCVKGLIAIAGFWLYSSTGTCTLWVRSLYTCLTSRAPSAKPSGMRRRPMKRKLETYFHSDPALRCGWCKPWFKSRQFTFTSIII